MNLGKNKLLLILVWIIEGIVVGFGAILPGISGGTLCVAFGMYRPIVETLSHLKTGLKKHWLMFFSFKVRHNGSKQIIFSTSLVFYPEVEYDNIVRVCTMQKGENRWN